MRAAGVGFAALGLACAGWPDAPSPEASKPVSSETRFEAGLPAEALPEGAVSSELGAGEPDLHPSFRAGRLQVHHERRQGDALRLWGLYENDSGRYVDRPDVFIEYFDGAGRRVGLDTVYVDREGFLPGAKAGVALLATPVPPHARRSLLVAGGSGIHRGEPPARGVLRVTHHEPVKGPLGENHRGDVVWDGPGNVRFARAYVTWYAADGTVVGAANAFTKPSELAPGDKATFETVLASLAGPAARVEVEVWGRLN